MTPDRPTPEPAEQTPMEALLREALTARADLAVVPAQSGRVPDFGRAGAQVPVPRRPPGSPRPFTHFIPLLAAACIVAVAAVPAAWSLMTSARPGPAVTEPGTASLTASCNSTTLSLAQVADTAIRRHDPGGAFHGATAVLTNTSSRPCTVTGYLDVTAWASGSAISTTLRAQHGDGFAADPGPQSVRLGPHGHAFIELYWMGVSSQSVRAVLTAAAPGSGQQISGHLELPDVDLSPGGYLTETALTPRPLLLPGEPFRADGYSQATLDLP